MKFRNKIYPAFLFPFSIEQREITPKVVILVRDMLSAPVLHFYQVS